MLFPVALLLALHTTPPADSIAGTWKLTGDVMGNPVNTTCVITQTGTTLGGSCTGEAGEKFDVTGEIKDAKFTFKYATEYQGAALSIVHNGTVASPTLLKGTIDVQPMGVSGTFTATPAPVAPSKP